MRINKFLSSCGLGSRRFCDRLVEEGRVCINGIPAKSGDQADENSLVTVDKKSVTPLMRHTYLLFYKPRGIVCTASKKEKNNIIDFLNYPVRLTYAGRLDKESEGLMLMTDDGDLISVLMHAGDVHEKEYEVRVARKLHPHDLRCMEAGVYLDELDRTTRACKIRQIDSYTFRIVLTEGMNREIRRICKKFQYPVVSLKRIRINHLLLGDLTPGAYRHLTKEEEKELQRLKKSGEDAKQ